MSTGTQPAPVSKLALWTGRVLSALPALLLTMSGVMKLAQPEPVLESFEHLGYDRGLALPLGILELACVVVYVIPRTAVLGAILMTGFMGGAIATHVRMGEPFFMQLLVGVIAWLGLYLREPRLRALIPFRKQPLLLH